MAAPGKIPGHRTVAIPIAIGVAIGLILVIGIPGLVRPVTSCALGSEVGSAWIWTPNILVNVPDGGSGSFDAYGANYSFASGSATSGSVPSPAMEGAGLLPGHNESGIVGDTGLAHWGLLATRNVTSAAGTGHPCTQPYVAELLGPLYCGAAGNLSGILALPNNASDLVQPHVVPPTSCSLEEATPGASFWFDTTYHVSTPGASNQSEEVSLCGLGSRALFNVTLAGVASYPVVVSIPVSGADIKSVGVMMWIGSSSELSPTAAYSMPGGWNWNISTITPGILPTVAKPLTTSLLAFERTAC